MFLFCRRCNKLITKIDKAVEQGQTIEVICENCGLEQDFLIKIKVERKKKLTDKQ